MVRDRAEEDLGACVRLLRNVHEADGYPMRWPADPRAWLAPPGRPFVAVADGNVAGHVLITPAGELSRLFVDPARRAGGFYERLGWTFTGTKSAQWDAAVRLRCYRRPDMSTGRGTSNGL